MNYRKLLAIAGAALFTWNTAFTALAGVWNQDNIGWWYQEDDGTYPANEWKWIDGNNDGNAECYYFDANGYLLTAANTPDGYQVDESGAWAIDSVVQLQKTNTYADVSGLYTYKEMQNDLSQLHSRFPEVPIVVESLGQTVDEREVYVLFAQLQLRAFAAVNHELLVPNFHNLCRGIVSCCGQCRTTT